MSDAAPPRVIHFVISSYVCNFQGHRPSGHENSAFDAKYCVGRSELSVWHIDETSLDQKTCT